MSAHNAGGPAFPVQEFNADGTPATLMVGMTLRDYFAAKATDKDVKAALLFGESWDDSEDRCCARFRHADAMLAARGAT